MISAYSKRVFRTQVKESFWFSITVNQALFAMISLMIRLPMLYAALWDLGDPWVSRAWPPPINIPFGWMILCVLLVMRARFMSVPILNLEFTTVFMRMRKMSTYLVIVS